MTTTDFPNVRAVVVIADCHIHPGHGPDWTPEALAAFAGADLIVTLGDMGETAGLDQLQAIAPVIGVRGMDDVEDDRTSIPLRTLRLAGASVGCVFDPVAQGLATRAEPFTPVQDWTTAAQRLFGGPVQVLLHASTHRPHRAEVDGILVVDPGSALLPADGAAASFARLNLTDGRIEAEIVAVPAI